MGTVWHPRLTSSHLKKSKPRSGGKKKFSVRGSKENKKKAQKIRKMRYVGRIRLSRPRPATPTSLLAPRPTSPPGTCRGSVGCGPPGSPRRTCPALLAGHGGTVPLLVRTVPGHPRVTPAPSSPSLGSSPLLLLRQTPFRL